MFTASFVRKGVFKGRAVYDTRHGCVMKLCHNYDSKCVSHEEEFPGRLLTSLEVQSSKNDLLHSQ